MTKDDLIKQIEAEASKLPGNKLGFTQPIEMRFNELIAGVREDLAVKVFGDDFEPMLRDRRPDRRRAAQHRGRRRREGRADAGLPFLEIRIDKAEIARRGLSLADVQDVIGDRGRRPRGRPGLRRRPALPDRRAPAAMRCAPISRRSKTCRCPCPRCQSECAAALDPAAAARLVRA